MKVLDAILVGNVDQHSISAKELAFKVCPWHDVRSLDVTMCRVKIPDVLVEKYEELFQQV